jgi:hypothetical protein
LERLFDLAPLPLLFLPCDLARLLLLLLLDSEATLEQEVLVQRETGLSFRMGVDLAKVVESGRCWCGGCGGGVNICRWAWLWCGGGDNNCRCGGDDTGSALG